MNTSSRQKSPAAFVPLSGFTLVELMVAMVVASLMVLSAMGIFIQQRVVLKSTQIINENQQNVRTAIGMMARDIRMAGYGIDASGSALESWIDWAEDLSGSAVAMDENPKIVDGGTGPDSIWIAAAFEAPVCTLAADALIGSTTLTVGAGEGKQFTNTSKRVIYVGKCETVRITAVAGDVLSISSHPTGTVGVHFDHPAGSSIELVKVRSYEVNSETLNYPYRPHLTRDNSTSSDYQYSWQRLIASGIEDLQLVRTDDRVDIEVTGLASVRDRYHFTGEDGSKVRRLALESSAYLRNNP